VENRKRCKVTERCDWYPPARSHNISRAVYAVKPSIPGWYGKVTCGVKIDDHGHVRVVHVKGTTDESVVKRIRAALINWEYEPATTNGHPSLGFVQVNVE
jgi:hypothetical protein